MMTRKDFERAAIRILCEMIVADGYVVKEELGELAKWAHEYKLWMPDYKPKGKCNKPSRKDDFNPIIGRFNTNKIQEAYGITLAKAITDVNEWNTTHKEDVDNLLKQLEQLSVVDSECTPNEARIRQALFYVLKKGAVALSVKKDYKFSKREIIYIENNIEDDYIVGELEELHWMNPDSEIWQGFEIFRDDSKESVDTEECFHNYLRDLYHGVNEDIQNNFYHYQRELKLMGFDFVYIPHTIAKMDGFGVGGELLLPAIQIVNPQKLYGKSFDEVLKVMRETRTHDFTHTLLSYELFNVLPNVIKLNFNKNENNNINETKQLQCYNGKELIPLGLFRIKIVDLLGNLFSYFKHIPYLYDKLLIESQFFENAFEYLFEYDLNNIYQQSLLFLLKKFLNYSENHPILSDFLFTKLNIMDTIISKLKATETSSNDTDTKKECFVYLSGNTTKKGYISFLISLAYKINTVIGGDPLRINDTLSREGSISFINRAAPFVAKEEITKFYGMEENELYEQVSNESD